MPDNRQKEQIWRWNEIFSFEVNIGQIESKIHFIYFLDDFWSWSLQTCYPTMALDQFSVSPMTELRPLSLYYQFSLLFSISIVFCVKFIKIGYCKRAMAIFRTLYQGGHTYCGQIPALLLPLLPDLGIPSGY